MWKSLMGFVVVLLTLGVQTVRSSSDQSPPRPREVDQAEMYKATGGDADRSKLPISFTVSQNYPNPFNLETTIEYSLPTQSGVYITIYDIMGEHVATLKNDIEGGGYHRIIWEGTNCQGVTVASGIYFFRIVADDFYALRKMILLK